MARRRAALSTVDDTVTTVVCGHTHMPFVRLVDRRLVVNPGSVGMPNGSVGAHWALLGPGTTVALRRTAYDIEAACARIAAESGYPDAARWADDYLHRAGRTARAGESGTVLTLVLPKQRAGTFSLVAKAGVAAARTKVTSNGPELLTLAGAPAA